MCITKCLITCTNVSGHNFLMIFRTLLRALLLWHAGAVSFRANLEDALQIMTLSNV